MLYFFTPYASKIMPVFAQITEYNDVQPKQSQSIYNTYLKFAMSSLTVVSGLFLRYLFK